MRFLHSPAPWRAGLRNTRLRVYADSARTVPNPSGPAWLWPIAEIRSSPFPEQDAANRLLIIASPELLRLTIDLVHRIRTGPFRKPEDEQKLLLLADATLRKAVHG